MWVISCNCWPTFLEEECRNEEVGALSSSGMNGKKEVKNLESSVNNDAKGSCSSCGKRKARGHPIVSGSLGFYPGM